MGEHYSGQRSQVMLQTESHPTATWRRSRSQAPLPPTMSSQRPSPFPNLRLLLPLTPLPSRCPWRPCRLPRRMRCAQLGNTQRAGACAMTIVKTNPVPGGLVINDKECQYMFAFSCLARWKRQDMFERASAWQSSSCAVRVTVRGR